MTLAHRSRMTLGNFRFAAMALAAASLLAAYSCKKDNRQKTDDDGEEPEEAVASYGDPVASGGWDIYKAGTYRYGPCFIINDDGSIDGWFSSPGGYHGQDKMKYNSNGHDPAYAWQIKNGDAAQYFKTTEPFYCLQVCCPSWGSGSESLTLKLYKWEGSYSTTVAGTPLYSERFENYSDNSWLTVYGSEDGKNDHDSSIPAGEYLWVASEGTSSAGIWGLNSSVSPGGMSPRSYKGGSFVDQFQFESRVLLSYTTGGLYWDAITYQHSEDGGKTWTPEKVTIIPTEFSLDQLSNCDAGIAKWGGWYYAGYTSTEDERGTDNNIFIARSKNPDGPWEKWNGGGWGGDKPMPVILYHGIGNPDKYGAGEPHFVVVDDVVYFYYSWNDQGTTTRVATASALDENWPASIEVRGTAIDKSAADIQSADHSDVKYRPDLKKFYAINTAKRMTEDSYIQIWTSDDGLKFTCKGKMKGTGFRKGLHNCGWSGDEKGHQDPSKPQYIGYAYGIGTWGQWNTWFAPISFEKK